MEKFGEIQQKIEGLKMKGFKIVLQSEERKKNAKRYLASKSMFD